MQVAMERILADLQKALPVVMERVTLADLVSIETEEFGAQHSAVARYGPNFQKHVSVGTFIAPRTSEDQ